MRSRRATQETLKQGGVHDAVMDNVKVQSPTGDLLVNQLRAGSLDAVIAYVSNATEAADELEAIAIKDIPCAVAVQPVAVGRDSTYKQLTARLVDATAVAGIAPTLRGARLPLALGDKIVMPDPLREQRTPADWPFFMHYRSSAAPISC